MSLSVQRVLQALHTTADSVSYLTLQFEADLDSGLPHPHTTSISVVNTTSFQEWSGTVVHVHPDQDESGNLVAMWWVRLTTAGHLTLTAPRPAGRRRTITTEDFTVTITTGDEPTDTVTENVDIYAE